ncbi:MAG: hypothetical protein AAF744_14840 [Pseudomonadota bacterium]
MDLEACYRDAIARRRAFSISGYPTLADAGFDWDLVNPIHRSSGNLRGPMLISKDWLDYPSALAHRDRLQETGYLPKIPYNRVMDLALAKAGLTRAEVYISPIFHLLTPKRSSTIPVAHARASFAAVGRYELLGRRPIALGLDAARVLAQFGIAHLKAPHPSARVGNFSQRAGLIAEALLQS